LTELAGRHLRSEAFPERKDRTDAGHIVAVPDKPKLQVVHGR